MKTKIAEHDDIPRPITLERARAELGRSHDAIEIVPAVGHEDTARLIAQALGLDLSQVHARVTLRLQGAPRARNDREIAIIGAYVGPRLPEGCTQLPEGATIEWWMV